MARWSRSASGLGEDRAAAEAAVAKRTVAILGVAFGCDANGGAPAQVIVDERSSGLARSAVRTHALPPGVVQPVGEDLWLSPVVNPTATGVHLRLVLDDVAGGGGALN